jgi:hypothetical protein
MVVICGGFSVNKFVRFETMADKVKIIKVGSDPTPSPKGGKTRRKSMKTYPRGIIKGTRVKIQGVKDPAKPPPSKTTLRILTEKGAEKKRQSIRKTIKHMTDSKVKQTLRASGFPLSDKTPPHIARQILEGGVEAGMIVAK